MSTEFFREQKIVDCAVFVTIRIGINVPIVFTARDVMILMRANPFRGPLKGVGPEK
jgi:hypothetical protein